MPRSTVCLESLSSFPSSSRGIPSPAESLRKTNDSGEASSDRTRGLRFTGITVDSPGRVPRPGESTVMPVNLRPLVRSELASPESFVFRKDSAGLGIPRDELGKLDKLSRQTVERGMASTRIYLSAPAVMGNGRAAN